MACEELDVGDQFGRSPLMYCVLADRPECAEILIKAGAQVNLKDKGGRTALHWAAHKVRPNMWLGFGRCFVEECYA